MKPSDIANEAVRIAAEEFGIELDYSVESLGRVDELLEDFSWKSTSTPASDSSST